MKLIFCIYCKDVVRLVSERRECLCGKSWGYYTDALSAVIGGKGVVAIGFENRSFVGAIINRPKTGIGERFDAFVMPEECPTIKEVKR